MATKSSCFGSIINLKPEFMLQYKALHSNTFPRVLEQIHKSHITDYTIFHHEGLLFSHMCYSGSNFELDMQGMADDKTTREWWILTDQMQKPVTGCPEKKWWADLSIIFEYSYSTSPSKTIVRSAFVVNKDIALATFAPDLLKNELIHVGCDDMYSLKIFQGFEHVFVYIESSNEIHEEALDKIFSFLQLYPMHPMEQFFHTNSIFQKDPMKKKVFVTGCFDMLHSGHVAFLQEAAEYGDLYVSIGSDANVEHLKGRYPVNSEDERRYMISALSCVTNCNVNTGWGIIDFENELSVIQPDIFIVNEDGHTPAKQELCNSIGIEYKVLKRIPHADLPVRSTTALRTECTIPFRIDLAGGWLDQPFVSKFSPGPVITISIEPTIEFNDRSGMSSSTRRKAIELWRNEIPHGDREQLARMLFSYENPPGTKIVAGSQDALGIVLPGLNKLDYNGHYWPESIISVHEEEILCWIEEHLYLISLGPRISEYDVLENTNIDAEKAFNLAAATHQCWSALQSRDIRAFGNAFRNSFEAQIAMFPNMVDESINRTINMYHDKAFGWKLSGAGGGGYLILVADKPIEGAIQIKIRRKNSF